MKYCIHEIVRNVDLNDVKLTFVSHERHWHKILHLKKKLKKLANVENRYIY